MLPTIDTAGMSAEQKAIIQSLANMLDARDEALTGKFDKQFTGVNAEIAKLKQGPIRLPFGGSGLQTNNHESLGAIVTKSKELQSFTSSESRIRGAAVVKIGGSFVTKATITRTTAGLITRTSVDPIEPLPYLPTTVIDLLPKRLLNGGKLMFTQQTGLHPVAGVQAAEGDAKAEGALTFIEVELTTQTMACWIPASTQSLRDVDGLQALIDSELVYAIKTLEDSEALNGTGGIGHLTGLLPGAVVVTPDAEDTPIDTVARVLMNLITRGFTPTGVVLNPNDFLSMALMKTVPGEYLMGLPSAPPPTTLWGIPLALSNGLAAGQVLAGDFRRAELRYAEDAHVDISTEHADFFIRNLVCIRAEEDMLLAVKQPAAFAKATFNAVTP